MEFKPPVAQETAQIVTWLAVAERTRQHSRILARIAIALSCLAAATGVLSPLLGWPAILPPSVGALVSASTLFIERRRSRTSRRIAEIKDSIDSALYGLPNSFMNSHSITAEEAASVGVIGPDEQKRYTNWYPDVDQLPQGYRVLLWQRSSAVWDIDLRNAATYAGYTFTALLTIGGLVVAYVFQLSVSEYLTMDFLPILPLLLTALQSALRNSDAARARSEIRELIESVWNKALAELQADIDASTAYVIKDAILQARRAGPPGLRILEAIGQNPMYHRMQDSANIMQDGYLESRASLAT